MKTRSVPLSAARFLALGVLVLAVGMAVWDVAVLLAAPLSGWFWTWTVLDVVVACQAVVFARRWPWTAEFDPTSLRLGRTEIPYGEIIGVSRDTVSVKPFWLAFWWPTSPLIGFVTTLIPATQFEHAVVELDTGTGRVWLRWRNPAGADGFLTALGGWRADLKVVRGIGATTTAAFAPRMGVAGGFLAAATAFWLIVGVYLGAQSADRSLSSGGPFPTDSTSAAIRSLTAGMTGPAPQAGLPVEFTEKACDYANSTILGSAPGLTYLTMKVEDTQMPDATALAVEARIRSAAGMAPDDYVGSISGFESTGVEVDVPETPGLSIYVWTGCVASADVPRLRDDLTAVATALGTSR